MKKNYITIKEAAEILGVNPMTLRRWDKKGKLKAARHRFNGYRIYNPREIEKLSKRMEVKSWNLKTTKTNYKK